MPTDTPGSLESQPSDLPPRSPLWGKLPAVAPPSEAQLARVRSALLARAARRRRVWRGLALATVGGVVLLWMQRQPPERVVVVLARALPAVQPPPVASAPTVAPPLVAPASPLAAPVSAHAISVAHPPEKITAAAVPEAPLADEESALLSRALTALHRGGDPERALGIVAEYQQRFPKGELAGEAELVRAESLLRLERREELVAELTPERIAELPRADELALLRSEALVQLGRCPQAVAELNALMERVANVPRLRARAQAALEACESPQRSQGGEEEEE